MLFLIDTNSMTIDILSQSKMSDVLVELEAFKNSSPKDYLLFLRDTLISDEFEEGEEEDEFIKMIEDNLKKLKDKPSSIKDEEIIPKDTIIK
jgi:hypothetical protein